jgi:hypothetical protein
MIKDNMIVNLWQNLDAQKKIYNQIDDYFFDVVGPDMSIQLTPEELDEISQILIKIAQARFKDAGK